MSGPPCKVVVCALWPKWFDTLPLPEQEKIVRKVVQNPIYAVELGIEAESGDVLRFEKYEKAISILEEGQMSESDIRFMQRYIMSFT